MLVFEVMIAKAAAEAGMKVPPGDQLDTEQWEDNDYPHFRVFCNIQLCRAISRPDQHWDNAKVIKQIPEEEIRQVTLKDLAQRGVELD